VLRFEPRDQSPDPEALAARRQLQALVWQCLQELPPGHREVLVMRDYQDMPYAEIAAALKVPKGTVMSRLHRARRQLHDLVRQRQRRTGEV
jgi:RNA polymerase sigma-70 factor, ECF subfamily